MSFINLKGFRARRPIVSERLLAANEATIARNVSVTEGMLSPLLGTLPVDDPTKVGDIATIYRWGAVKGGDAKGLITGATKANPCVLTMPAHGRTNGQRIHLSGVAGMTQLNRQTVVVTVVDTDHVSIGINSTGYGTYTSGGQWVVQNGYWFHWTVPVDVVPGPIAGDTTERTFYTDGTAPKYTYSPIAVSGGGTDYPNNSYLLGIPAPASAPTAVDGGTSQTCDAADQIDCDYVFTYVSAEGDEGPPSSPSAILTFCPDTWDADLSDLLVAPSGNYNITQKRIYRYYNGTYYLVATLPIATTTYNDTLSLDELTRRTTLVSLLWDPPPADLHSLRVMANGIGIGLSGKDIYFSVAFQLHAWPSSWALATDKNGIGIEVFGSSAAVFAEDGIYLVTGTDPSAMSMVKLKVNQVCSSKYGIAQSERHGVVFPTPDGICSINATGTVTLLSEKFITREQWQTYKPESIHGFMVEGQYVMFYDNGTTQAGLIFDPDFGFFDLDLYATAGFYDILTDSVYLVINNYIERWNADALNKLTITWKSGPIRMPIPTNFGWIRVLARSYAGVQVKIYRDNGATITKTLTSGEPVRLPGDVCSQDFRVEYTGKDIVEQITVSEGLEDLIQAV